MDKIFITCNDNDCHIGYILESISRIEGLNLQHENKWIDVDIKLMTDSYSKDLAVFNDIIQHRITDVYNVDNIFDSSISNRINSDDEDISLSYVEIDKVLILDVSQLTYTNNILAKLLIRDILSINLDINIITLTTDSCQYMNIYFRNESSKHINIRTSLTEVLTHLDSYEDQIQKYIIPAFYNKIGVLRLLTLITARDIMVLMSNANIEVTKLFAKAILKTPFVSYSIINFSTSEMIILSNIIIDNNNDPAVHNFVNENNRLINALNKYRIISDGYKEKEEKEND